MIKPLGRMPVSSTVPLAHGPWATAQIPLRSLRCRKASIAPFRCARDRINLVRVRLPPLREWPQPISSEGTMHALQAHSWPGNVRELENVMHLAPLVSNGNRIRPEHLKFPEAFEHCRFSQVRTAPDRPRMREQRSLSPQQINVSESLR